MAQSVQPGRFGHSGKPDDAWLAKQEKEPILEPELPIVDTHHHLWDRGGWTYLLPELLADLNTGHNIVATVFEECRSMYRADGSMEMRPVGEIEFVAGIAAMSASGGYGPIKVAQGIVGYADLALGDRVEPVLEALIRAGGGRLQGRALLGRLRCRPDHRQQPTGFGAPYVRPARSPCRGGASRRARVGARRLVLPSAARRCDRLARAVPQATIVMCHVGGVLGYGAYAGKKDEVHAAWRASMAELATCPNVSVKLGGMLNRGAALNFREHPAPPNSDGLGRGLAALCRALHRVVRRRSLQFREQFSGRQDGHRLRTLVERVQAHHRRMLSQREARPLQRHGEAALPSRLRHYSYLQIP